MGNTGWELEVNILKLASIVMRLHTNGKPCSTLISSCKVDKEVFIPTQSPSKYVSAIVIKAGSANSERAGYN